LGAADVDPGACFSTELCQECYFVDQQLGYWLLFLNNALLFYTSTAPVPQNTLHWLQADFNATRTRLDAPGSTLMVLGDSVTNPARFPPLDRSMWHYVGDSIQNKLRFSDIQVCSSFRLHSVLC
jgi:hypothetical protein